VVCERGEEESRGEREDLYDASFSSWIQETGGTREVQGMKVQYRGSERTGRQKKMRGYNL